MSSLLESYLNETWRSIDTAPKYPKHFVIRKGYDVYMDAWQDPISLDYFATQKLYMEGSVPKPQDEVYCVVYKIQNPDGWLPHPHHINFMTPVMEYDDLCKHQRAVVLNIGKLLEQMLVQYRKFGALQYDQLSARQIQLLYPDEESIKKDIKRLKYFCDALYKWVPDKEKYYRERPR
jgi:hypothetical protein